MDISASGISFRLVADKTFPTGITLTHFADDADPFDIPALEIATASMNVNGDLVTFSSPKPIPITLNVLPDSEDDENLSVIGDANTAGKNKRIVGDVITLVGTYPSGKTITLARGKLTSWVPASSASSAGRLKSKPYIFAFQSITRTR